MVDGITISKLPIDLQRIIKSADADKNNTINNSFEATKALDLIVESKVSSLYPQTVSDLKAMKGVLSISDRDISPELITLRNYFVGNKVLNFPKIEKSDKHKANYYFMDESKKNLGLSKEFFKHLTGFLKTVGYDVSENSDPKNIVRAMANFQYAQGINPRTGTNFGEQTLNKIAATIKKLENASE